MEVPSVEELLEFDRQMEEERKKARPAVRRQPNPPARRTARRSSNMPPAFISPLGLSAGMANIMPARQANHLQGMADDVMSAISKENYSRVAQAREMRRMQDEREAERERMQHEKDLLLMRLQAMR